MSSFAVHSFVRQGRRNERGAPLSLFDRAVTRRPRRRAPKPPSPVIDPSLSGGVPTRTRRSSSRARPRGVRDRPRADRDDHAFVAASPSAAIGRRAEHGARRVRLPALVAGRRARGRNPIARASSAGVQVPGRCRIVRLASISPRDRSARGELRRGGSHRHAVRPGHGASVCAGAWRAQEQGASRRPSGCARGRRPCASARRRAGTLERFDATESYPRSAPTCPHGARRLRGGAGWQAVRARQVEVGVFDWLVAFLRLLDADGASAERLRVFESACCRAWVRSRCRYLRDLRRRQLRRRAVDMAFRWDPDRGGAVCIACARGGRPVAAWCARRWSACRGPLAEATAQALPVDVNRDCREALLEIINHHVRGPLKTVEFIAKVARAGGSVTRPRCSASATSRSTSAIWRRRSGSGRRDGLRGRVASRSRQRLPGAGATTWRCTEGRVRPGAASTTSASRSPRPADVDAWAAHLEARGVAVKAAPRPAATARARSTSTAPGAAHPDHPPRADVAGIKRESFEQRGCQAEREPRGGEGEERKYKSKREGEGWRRGPGTWPILAARRALCPSQPID